jgi:hypothetical protein
MIPVPKEWTEQDLQEAFADELALAALHPNWRRQRYVAPTVLTEEADLCIAARRGGTLSSPGASRLAFSTQPTSPPPHWRRDWVAAGQLSTQLGLSTYHDIEEGAVSVSAGDRRRNVTERYEDHPSKDAATWAALTRAAIQKLEAGNN